MLYIGVCTAPSCLVRLYDFAVSTSTVEFSTNKVNMVKLTTPYSMQRFVKPPCVMGKA